MALIPSKSLLTWLGALALAPLLMVVPALAQMAGQPEPWGLGMQASVTSIMDQIRWFESYTLIIITVITLFVLALIIVVVLRFRKAANPTASKFTHNTMIEVVWTTVPVLILVAIAFPSFRLLYSQTSIPEAEMTVKMIGGQWYWQYEYMDEDLADIGTITSYMLDEDDRAARKEQYGLDDIGVPRLLAVDFPLVVPEDTIVHVYTTSLDVNHAIAVPSFGIKADSIKGRLNESWFNAAEPGIYYGQCSQLCGRAHAFMPLEVRVVTKERFETWQALAKENMGKATEQLLVWQSEDSGTPVAALTN